MLIFMGGSMFNLSIMLNWRKFFRESRLRKVWMDRTTILSEVLNGMKCCVESYWVGKKIPQNVRYVILSKIDLTSPAFENIISIHQSFQKVIN